MRTITKICLFLVLTASPVSYALDWELVSQEIVYTDVEACWYSDPWVLYEILEYRNGAWVYVLYAKKRAKVEYINDQKHVTIRTCESGPQLKEVFSIYELAE